MRPRTQLHGPGMLEATRPAGLGAVGAPRPTQDVKAPVFLPAMNSLADPLGLDPHSLCLRSAAERRGNPTDIVVGSHLAFSNRSLTWLRLGFGGRDFFACKGLLLDGAGQRGTMLGSLVNRRGVGISRDKVATKAVLDAAGIPTPKGWLFGADQRQEALDFARKLGGSVCVKPRMGSSGLLVYPDLRHPEQIAAAFTEVVENTGAAIVEQSLNTPEIRHFFVWPKAGPMLLALPPTVTGDGRRSIAALIAAMNAERERRALPGTFAVEVNDRLMETIAASGFSLDSVPEPGRQVVLRHAVNRAMGGECLSLPGRIHPSYAEVAGAACRALPDLRVASVDMKVLDPEQPAAPGNHWVLEINASSGLMPFHYPSAGPAQDISSLILDYLEARAAGKE